MQRKILEVIAGQDSLYEGVKVMRSMGEMPTETAVQYAKAYHTLLRKSDPVAVSGASLTVMPDGKLEVSHGGHMFYIAPQDLELLQEQATLAIRARENYAPDATDSMQMMPQASTDASMQHVAVEAYRKIVCLSMH